MATYQAKFQVYDPQYRMLALLRCERDGQEIIHATIPDWIAGNLQREAKIVGDRIGWPKDHEIWVAYTEDEDEPTISTIDRSDNPFNQPGYKDDKQKSWPWLVLSDFPLALEQVIAIGTFGAKKYTCRGWDKVDDLDARYREAFGRHLMEELKDHFSVDPEHGQTHIAAMIWNLLAILEHELREKNGEQ